MFKHVIIGFVFCLYLAGCHNTKPIATDPYIWDFARIKEGSIVSHDFVLVNRSVKTLNIKDVTTSCGCTVPQIAKKVLLPQEKTVVRVEFNTKGYLGMTSQFVYVHTDDVQEPVMRFVIKADIFKEDK